MTYVKDVAAGLRARHFNPWDHNLLQGTASGPIAVWLSWCPPVLQVTEDENIQRLFWLSQQS